METLRDQILKLRPSSGHWTKGALKKIELALGTEIYSAAPNARTFPEAVYHCLNAQKEIPICALCGTTLNFFGLKSSGQYKKYCGSKCSALGSYSVGQATKEKNGTDFAFGSENLKKRTKEKYGVEHFGQIESVKQKIKSTLKERYGVESGLALDKTKKAAHTKKAQEKRHQTFIDVYGTPSNFGRKSARDNIEKTVQFRYGVNNVMQDSEIAKKVWDSRFDPWRDQRLSALSKTVELVSEVNDIKHKHSKVTWRCITCKSTFISDLDCGKTPRCYSCYPNEKIGSKLESFVLANLLNDLQLPLRINDRTRLAPYEIDFLIGDIGIEINGLYWHSSGVSGDNEKDLRKQILAEEKGVQLLQFFEDEILNKTDLVRSIIRTRLGLIDQLLYARKCQVVNLTAKDASAFCNENHLQGFIGGHIKLGLIHENELVACMIVGKSRFNKGRWEIIRFCMKKYSSVVGAFGKLLKQVEAQLKHGIIETYADRRLFTGAVYQKHGFVFDHATKSGFYVTDYLNRYSRFNFQKHKIEMPLLEYLQINKLDRIFDCGQLVFIKNVLTK